MHGDFEPPPDESHLSCIAEVLLGVLVGAVIVVTTILVLT
jgi:hypothetical protein